MTFGADFTGAYGDKAFLQAFSDFDTHFIVDWGDGSSDELDRDGRRDDDGVRYSNPKPHSYHDDGVYDITVTLTSMNLPAIHLQAFLHSKDTDDLRITTSDLGDLVVAGNGTNRIDVAGGNDAVVGGSGIDHVSGGVGDDRLYGETGNDVVKGGTGSDILGGEFGDDQLYGGKGADLLFGDSGADQLFGGKGDDRIYGDDGADRLSGGAGADTFISYATPDIADDQILDFSGVNGDGDKLDLNRVFFHDAYVGYTFIGNDKFDGQAPELREVQGATSLDHIIQGDEDGDGQRDFSFFVHGDVITAQDFDGLAQAASRPGFGVHPAMMAGAHAAFAGVPMDAHLAIA